jgi:DNA-binding response OmpR family regulator
MSNRKLLIVDDDAHIRRLLRIYLRPTGFELHEAGTGEEALRLLEEHEFEVVLLDLILPYYGGFRICQRIRASGRSPYVIIMTGDDSPETRQSAKECGADDFVGKPFSAADLVEKINGIGARV